jgi:antitoxin component YwqK of YwqJK toxin-antitoxin module
MKKISLLVASFWILSSCSGSYAAKEPQLTHVQLIDRNGVNETISQKDRLEAYQRVNFLEAQPYEKVVRVFKRDAEGKVASQLTTYHDNGGVFQYLEVVGGRANGVYKEWYENGKLRIVSHVIEGVGDLSPDAQTSWIFDKESSVWNQKGDLIAEIFYEKGKLEKEALYYHANGRLAKTIPYKNDVIHGEKRIYDVEGNYVGGTHYVDGIRDGRSFFLGDKNSAKREEVYEKGLLMSGKYFDFSGSLTHEIEDGKGIRPFYEEGFLSMEHEYIDGKPEGMVKMYRKNGDIECMYQIVDGQKQGEEFHYYERKGSVKEPLLMLQMNWRDDEVHGTVRTWYINGKIESEKEMAGNAKQGKYIAWYEDGNLMMIEEYEKDVLMSGKYFKKGEEIPTSRVSLGSGTATFFDSRGNFLRKTEYQKGLPIE